MTTLLTVSLAAVCLAVGYVIGWKRRDLRRWEDALDEREKEVVETFYRPAVGWDVPRSSRTTEYSIPDELRLKAQLEFNAKSPDDVRGATMWDLADWLENRLEQDPKLRLAVDWSRIKHIVTADGRVWAPYDVRVVLKEAEADSGA